MGKFGLVSFATLFALVVNGCDNGSNNAAEYDYEVIDNERDSSAVTVRDTIYDTIQMPPPEVLVYPPQGGDTLAYLSSSTADTPESSALEVDPGASSGIQGPPP